MSNEMSSWKSLTAASSRLHSVRDFISQRDLRGALPTRKQLQPGDRGYVEGQYTPQSWSQWAGQKIKRNPGSDSGRPGVDSIMLFPGWAVRRYRLAENGTPGDAFEVDVFVSGYASTQRPPELATRSQRAFMRLAKGFASLPKLPGKSSSSSSEGDMDAYPPRHLTPSTERLLASIELPPRPTEITEDYEIQALEKQFRRAELSTQHVDRPSLDLDSDSLSSASSSRFSSRAPSPTGSETPAPSAATNSAGAAIAADIRKLHANLEARLQPFWSSALSSRTIRVSLSASPHKLNSNSSSSGQNNNDEDYFQCGPVATRDVLTAADGSFVAKFTIPWEDLCQHPRGVHIAFAEATEEHDLVVEAELLPLPLSLPPNLQSTASYFPRYQSPPQPRTTTRVSLTHSEVRVISDIDDTVKMSSILSGARAVFYNVFVKDLRDIIIPGMGEWYLGMWTRGVRFHYVSNGPFELLPVVNDFLQISQLPPGSIKLKSYAGRSLFNGLLSAPATRKRAGIVEVLDSFPSSRFFMMGDSGEQDLELYASLAGERPKQILGIFVRDANTYEDGVDGVSDPTGFQKLDEFFAPLYQQVTPSRGDTPTPMSNDVASAPTPLQRQAMTDPPTPKPPSSKRLSVPALTTGYFSPSAPTHVVTPSLTDEPTSYAITPGSSQSDIQPSSRPARRSPQSMTESQRKRMELQARIYRARKHIPAHIPLRIFRQPEECIEAESILNKLHIGIAKSNS